MPVQLTPEQSAQVRENMRQINRALIGGTAAALALLALGVWALIGLPTY